MRGGIVIVLSTALLAAIFIFVPTAGAQIDTQPPLTTLSTDPSAPNGTPGWFVTVPAIKLSANEPAVSYYQWETTAGAWNQYDGPLPALEGGHLIYYYSVDSANNTETIRKRFLRVDTMAAEASMSPPPISTNVSGTLTFPVSCYCCDIRPSSGEISCDIQYKVGSASTVWKSWQAGSNADIFNFTGAPGKTYYFRVRAKDAAGNVGPWSQAKETIVPHDQNSLVLKRRGFAKTYSGRGSKYYLGTVRYSKQRKTWITYRFSGKSVALITTKGPNRSKAKIYLDGVYKKTVDAFARTNTYRQPIFSKTWKRAGKHTLKIVNLGTRGRPRFDIDGLAVAR